MAVTLANACDKHSLPEQSNTQLITPPLSLFKQIIYVLPSMGIVLFMGAMGIIQGIYAKYFGVSLTTIATVILIARLFDAFTDPLIGFLSDRQLVKTGSRKPFILMGGVLFFISSYFLLVPVGFEPGATVSTPYFIGWFLAFYLAYTLFEIPHQSWGAELAATAEQKNTLFSLRSAASHAGSLLFYLLPFLPIFEGHAFTPETLKWSVWAGGLLLLPSLYFCLKHVPASCEAKQNASALDKINTAVTSTSTFRLTMITRNRPLLLFFAAYFFYALGIGLFSGLVFIFYDSYLAMGEVFVEATLYGATASIVCLVLWRKLANSLGKKAAWIVNKLVFAFVALLMTQLVPGEVSFVVVLLPLLLVSIASAGNAAITPALLSDIIDYSRWKYRTESTAIYFSLYTLSAKGVMALGGALGLAIVGGYGFDPANVVYTDEVHFGIRLATGGLPMVFLLVSAVLVLLIPINSHRHRIIRRSLDKRAQRES